MTTETIVREIRRSMSLSRSPAKQSSSAQDLYGSAEQSTKAVENSIKDVPREQLKPGTKIDKEDYPWELVESIDSKDKGTPDQWVPRHPGLIRLTGRHPFNVEPNPSTLMGHGFVTPSALHYVRNHGPVPRLKWDEHKLTVTGLVNKPRVFTMDEIAAMPQHTVLCTLTCAGNRRKEQNMVKKTIGFSWGPAGTACSYWTGVKMSHLMRLCGVDEDNEDLHVCFRGPKGELPKGDTTYGTSIPLWKAMWEGSEVIVCWKQNGRLLDPDHGFPVRIIIPGHIGGRMVKWMEEIEVTKQESQNHYHFHDNRVLPSHVDEALAKAEGWWFKPDFSINELNINSAITSPAHDETQEYRETTIVKGYAYAGGDKIIRCEVSLNDGESWLLADIRRIQEKANKGGRWWAWVHWDIEIPTADLLNTKEMSCRAWSRDMNTQPNNFTWNLMGMMNNCVYRVKIHPSVKKGMLALRYEHPTLAGTAVGGWMNRGDEQQAVSVETKAPPPKPSGGGRKISMAEVEMHASKESAWFVRDGLVYDGTAFMADHPGGAESIILGSGMDSSEDFNAIHSAKAKKMLDDYYIGDLDDSAPMPEEAAGAAAEKKEAEKVEGELIALNPRKKQSFKLIENTALSHNVRRFRFALQSPQHRFGLPCGKHVYIYGKVNGEAVIRAYTPTSSDDDLGYFDLVIKVYWANDHPKFPEGGKLSQWLSQQEIGSMVEAKGPVGHFHYLGMGNYTMDGEEGKVTHMSMVGGGTGLTPCYAVAKEVLKRSEDTTQVSLIYCNQTPDDILLWDELKELEAKHDNFKVWYCVSDFKKDSEIQKENWRYDTGRITLEMAKTHLFPPAENRLALFCGPPAMITYACEPFCKQMGYTQEQIVIF